jgi:ribulose-phosphate 3-epimerase
MDFRQLEHEILELENADIHELHFDIMDGTFVPNITMGFEAIRAVRQVTKLPLVAHLMIVRPERYIDRFREAGCDAITIHAESTRHPHMVIKQIRDTGAVTGLALNPATPLSTAEYLLSNLGKILLMAVEPGFAGQRAVPDIAARIQKAKELVKSNGTGVEIGVDGNISADNAPELISAGASFLVLGTSSIFNQPERPAAALRSFRDKIGAG